MTSPIIELENVSRHYGQDESLVRAVDQVDLRIHPGEFTALVGPSGSGKSTLLNLMSGLDVPTGGSIRLAGRKLEDISGNELADFRRDNIGFIFQAYNLIPVLTVAENVEYILLLQGIPTVERRERVDRMLKEVGLEGKQTRRPGELSGGQQQRVAVARAMVTEPKLILADEPTANLDSHTGAALLDMMRRLNETRGATFVFSTHDPQIMERARRLVTLRDGKVAEDEERT